MVSFRELCGNYSVCHTQTQPMSTSCHSAVAYRHRTGLNPPIVNESAQTVTQPLTYEPDGLITPGNASATTSASAAALTAQPVAADGSPGHLNRQQHVPFPTNFAMDAPLTASEAKVRFSGRYSEEMGTRLFNSAQCEEISQLCQFFKKTLLVHIPILTSL